MTRLRLAPAPSAAGRWLRSVVLGTAATAGTATALGGVPGLLVAVAALAATLSGELLGLVQARSRGLHDELLERLAAVRLEHADETVDARSHDPFAHVGRLLEEYTPRVASVAASLQGLRDRLQQVERLLERSRVRRERWATTGPTEHIGGLAGESDSGVDLKRYGDPANLPGWLSAARSRAALLRVGAVLDDIRLLHSHEIEWAVLTFTLWARALLLVLAPALGALSFAPAPDVDAGTVRPALWLLALAWAVGSALAAPRIATLAMEESSLGLRARRVLLAVELPLAVALSLAWPGWPAVAFAAGWTNWWQRLGRSPVAPGFSWTRLGVWIAVAVAAQSSGLVLAAGDVAWWHAVLEVAIALGVIAIIGGSYGAMLPATAGVAARVLFTGARTRRLAGTDAQRLIDDIAEAMTRAADELAALAHRGPADEAAEGVLRRAVDGMLPAATARRRRGARELGAIVTAALAEGGHDMWVEDPRAVAAQDRADGAGQVRPVVVDQPAFATGGITDAVVDAQTADTLHRLLVACIVEARVHGTRRVQTILSRDGDTVEVRVANQPNPRGSRRGRGRGVREIQALAGSLPGATALFRGATDRAFVGANGEGVLFGVSFTFTVSDTAAGAARDTRTGL